MRSQKPMRFPAVFLFCEIVLFSAVRADVAPNPLFGDHAVLQRERPVPVWGTGAPGELVAVSYRDTTVKTVTDKDGRWEVSLPEQDATSAGADLVIAGKNTVTLHDVVVGEVWLCSGQSNMGFVLSRNRDAETEIAGAHYPLIRELNVNGGRADQPVDTVATGGWKQATPENVANFTAVGYFFARELQETLQVPVGLIRSTVGGTPVEAWMSREAFATDPDFADIADRATIEDQTRGQGRYPKLLKKWNDDHDAAKAKGPEAEQAFLKGNPQPRPQGGTPKAPYVLFNGKIAPLKPYAFRGVLWYQGEANSDRGGEYHKLFAAMITDWRRYFGAGDFPFYWVQLPNFAAGFPEGDAWAIMREAQAKTLSLPNTGQAVAIDVGEADNLHPTNKEPVGHRLALIAEAKTYGLDREYSGPVFDGVAREGAMLRVKFTHAAGLKTESGVVNALQVAGDDGVFYAAEAQIDGETLLVSSPQVAAPVAVRYAWRNAPDANLENGDGLPAAPFRSDSW